MTHMDRRASLKTLLITAGALASGGLTACSAAAPVRSRDHAFNAAVQTIEQATGGRLGVAVLDTRNGAFFGYRADERFPLCSTFKMAAAALVLHRVDAGLEQLDRPVRFGVADQVAYGPVTEPKLPDGQLSVGELCGAIVTVSDNTAANLLLRSFGGPVALTAWLRSIGDPTTRLDRTEPTLNTAIPGDLRDTTTPRAMATTLRRIALGEVLAPASRQQLLGWMQASTTGDKKIKAGLPAGWRVAGKTSNDIAVLWPPSGAPLVVSAYLTETTATGDQKDKALAGVGALAASLRG